MDRTEIYKSVQDYYGKVLSSSKDLKINACTTGSRPNKLILDILKKVPQEIKNKYYGCGTPIPMGIEGLDVIDLGSGSGQDCYILSALVKESGKVFGIDMTQEQIDLSRKYITDYTQGVLKYDKSNMEFDLGFIENLATDCEVKSEMVDLVISNCVINLSPRKDLVLSGAYKILKEGGEFYFSDVYCDRRLPDSVRSNEILLGECIAGALYIEDFTRLCHQIGFTDIRILTQSPITINNAELNDVVGNTKFYSITYRCFKISDLEKGPCEDYGQYAIYNGKIPQHPHSYTLDRDHTLQTGKPFLVCGNTADMLSKSWLKPYFQVVGDKTTHYGVFDCKQNTKKNNFNQDDFNQNGSCCG